ILVNNAGVNINDRHWDKLTPENAKLMIDGNLAATAQCVTVALPLMRAQQGGLIIHTASMAAVLSAVSRDRFIPPPIVPRHEGPRFPKHPGCGADSLNRSHR